MSKVKEMIDLKAKPVKITAEQLEGLQSVVSDNNAIQFRVGNLEAQKHMLLHELGDTQDRIATLQRTLSEEYGTFDVDLKDGTINYSLDE
tara:strand:+ start:4557 stop:4826 length:270 start_codon:yes stop_codon:yes gene_type:complete